MKKTKRIVALLLAALLCVGVFSACGGNSSSKKESGASGDKDTNATPDQASDSGSSKSGDTPLVVGYAPFNSKFSPFFAETAYDQDVASMVHLNLLNSDRTGAIVEKGYNGGNGTTIAYNGTDYTSPSPRTPTAPLTMTSPSVTILNSPTATI